jgi:solute carrier family 32 (vesicular inhibitory amino acid transporter)
MRINSIRQAGGPNSIDNFARSWQRAAAFHEITPARRSFVLTESDESGDDVERDEERGLRQHRSLLRQQIEQASAPSEDAIEEEPEVEESTSKTPLLPERRPSGPIIRSGDVVSLTPQISSFAGSFTGSYGALSARITDTSRRRATQIFEGHILPRAEDLKKEAGPILIKETEREDGTKAYVVVGQSTLPQTVFNSSNVLIGIGMLSLPLGVKYSGWIVGMGFLLFSAVVTRYTASLLARCLDVDQSLVTFADLAFISFGQKARIVTSFLFSFELIAACVALVVLFADSLDALISGLSILEWKVVCGLILVPLNFVPLRLLSFSSILGIMCCLGSKFRSFFSLNS